MSSGWMKRRDLAGCHERFMRLLPYVCASLWLGRIDFDAVHIAPLTLSRLDIAGRNL